MLRNLGGSRAMKLAALLLAIPLLLVGCASGQLPGLATVTPEEMIEPFSAQELEVEPSRTLAFTATLPLSPSPVFTWTPLPSLTPIPTETPLPTLDLPTENSREIAFLTWTGLPTYPGDSEPGRLFEVRYDPDLWVQMDGNLGEVVLALREDPTCIIVGWSGRGLPTGSKVEQEFRDFNGIIYDVSIVRVEGQVRFYTYTGGDRRILTGFQVTPGEQPEACLREAEKVFASIRSFTGFPTSTPFPTP